MQFQRILIAIDNSPHSMNAAKKGFELAQALNASVGVAYIIDIMKEPVIPETGRISESTQNKSLTKANRVIDKLVKSYPDAGEITRFTSEGFPKKEIVMIAKNWEADLIVMGTHGRTGLSYLILGSVSEYVIKHSAVPVMVVPLK
ncbi:MAG TPA: universal stress protein [Niabella sp.]|jgi:nucleotide-binding universal stress UspA family protein|nr:universal stress protein [Chitinophagaceae bacterium]HRN47153.1 universal stress protein [Niabella sp.]HRO83649.1 universal stress protein [Niabella sp.]HUN02391.1 universal stress protein [Niabella sp.]